MALPKYDQIAGDIRGRIVRGELRAGDALPSERELTERWSVARATVVRALDVLRQEGLVETRQGTGSTVRERAPLARTAGERYRTAVRTGQVYTAGEYAEIIGAELLPTPEEVATALNINVGEQVARRHRVTFEGETRLRPRGRGSPQTWPPRPHASSTGSACGRARPATSRCRPVGDRTPGATGGPRGWQRQRSWNCCGSKALPPSRRHDTWRTTPRAGRSPTRWESARAAGGPVRTSIR